MARATITATVVEITCPECDEGIEAPNDSYSWMAHEYGAVAGKRIQCPSCGAAVQVPKLTRIPV